MNGHSLPGTANWVQSVWNDLSSCQAEMGVTQMTILSWELEADDSASGLWVEERGVGRIEMGMNVRPPKGYCLWATTQPDTRDQQWSLTLASQREVNRGEILLVILVSRGYKERHMAKLFAHAFAPVRQCRIPFDKCPTVKKLKWGWWRKGIHALSFTRLFVHSLICSMFVEIFLAVYSLC